MVVGPMAQPGSPVADRPGGKYWDECTKRFLLRSRARRFGQRALPVPGGFQDGTGRTRRLRLRKVCQAVSITDIPADGILDVYGKM